MSRAKKNMMKRLSIEELVDIYLNSDGETEKTACSEIEDRYWEEYEVRREILLKLVASEKDKSWRLVVALPPVWGDEYIDVFRAMAEDDILTWVKRMAGYWPELGMEAKRILELKHPQIYTFNHYYSFSDAAYFLLFSCCVMNSDFAINQEVVCQVTDYLAEYNSAKRRSMRVPIKDCPVYEMVEDVYSRMTQDLDRGRYNEEQKHTLQCLFMFEQKLRFSGSYNMTGLYFYLDSFNDTFHQDYSFVRTGIEFLRFLKRNHVNPEWLEEYAISLSKSMLKNVCKYKRMEIEYLQEELRRFVCEERHNEVTPLEAWQEYKRSMEKPLSLNSELMKKMLGMHPELKYLVGDIDDCQQEDADAPVQGENPDATIFIEKFFQTDNDVPF